MVEEQSGRKNLVGVQKFITTNMSQDRSQIWFKLPPLHDNLVFFVSELVSRPLQDVSVAFNRFFLDAISISTVGCETHVTSQAIHDVERV